MLKLGKKLIILSSLFIFGLGFLLLNFKPAVAANLKPIQVKAANSPIVYFLHYGSHRKKAYVNATSYLSYNNKWSDIKTVGAPELAAWPDIKLIRTGSSPAIYYIKGNLRARLNNRDDLESFGFIGEPILNVDITDLNQYRLVGYEEIGLVAGFDNSNSAGSTNSNSSGTEPPASLGDLLVFSDSLNLIDNTLVDNTNDNLLGIFRFQATKNVATITSLTFHFGGVYNNDLLKQAIVKDANNNVYPDSDLRTNSRELIITFREPLTINPGTEKTLKVFLDLNAGDYNNQTTQLEIDQTSDIKTNLTPTLGSVSDSAVSWPLKGTLFKLLSANNLIGSLTLQKESLVGVSNLNSGVLMGKFTLTEISGKEDAVIKKIVFRNAGSAHNDLTNFSLANNGQIIARVPSFDSDGNIAFNINYLRVSKASFTSLTVNADLTANYNKQATIDLQALDLSGLGQSYNFSLPIKITNLSEPFALN